MKTEKKKGDRLILREINLKKENNMLFVKGEYQEVDINDDFIKVQSAN